MRKLFLILSAFVLTQAASAENTVVIIKDLKPVDVWVPQQEKISYEKLLQNINPPGTASGVVVASPQTENPNYFRHWIRDAALVMDVVLQKEIKSTSSAERKKLNNLLTKFMYFSIDNQSRASLGEPIIEVSGNPFVGPWGRPQNDGPALRATVLTKWALLLLQQGKYDFVKKYLYSEDYPAKTLIKKDLEYVASEWSNPCFDLWEEVKAKHFYTLMVQRKSLILGSELARQMNDFGASDWYLRQASQIEGMLRRFVPGKNSKPLSAIARNNYIIASVDWTEGMTSKTSNLDISVILGVLHGELDQVFSVTDANVLNTFYQLSETFYKLYPINRTYADMAPAIGRYPEDIYAGTNFDGGNPWMLTTLAMAEYSYKMATARMKNASTKAAVVVAKKWIDQGNQFMQRVQLHVNPDGSMSEQIDRFSGYMSSARDLTWSYAAFLTATWSREQALLAVKLKK